ncbi:hypothetical protein Prudu_28S000100, partial [Prunus dulcis]
MKLHCNQWYHDMKSPNLHDFYIFYMGKGLTLLGLLNFKLVFQLAAHPPFPASDKGWGKELGQSTFNYMNEVYVGFDEDIIYNIKDYENLNIVIVVQKLVNHYPNRVTYTFLDPPYKKGQMVHGCTWCTIEGARIEYAK